MKIAVIGSRNINLTTEELKIYIPRNAEALVSGGARGIDSAAAIFSREAGIPLIEIKPNYERYGRGAPIIRNREIVSMADLVIIIWDGVSRGSKNVIEECTRQGKDFTQYIINKNEEP